MNTRHPAPAVNYIKHIDLFFEISRFSPAINYGHIALYISLFRAWNLAFFTNPMSPAREDVMAYAGIKSKECYYRIVRQLSSLDLIRYHPSKSKYETALFCMSSLEWVDEGIKITVWSVSNHDTLSGTKLQDSPDKTSLATRPFHKPHNLDLINGRGLLMIEKQVVLDIYPNSAIRPSEVSQGQQMPLNSDKHISSSFKNNYHAHAIHSQSKHSGLHPSGIQIDPDADYSVPL